MQQGGGLADFGDLKRFCEHLAVGNSDRSTMRCQCYRPVWKLTTLLRLQGSVLWDSVRICTVRFAATKSKAKYRDLQQQVLRILHLYDLPCTSSLLVFPDSVGRSTFFSSSTRVPSRGVRRDWACWILRCASQRSWIFFEFFRSFPWFTSTFVCLCLPCLLVCPDSSDLVLLALQLSVLLAAALHVFGVVLVCLYIYIYICMYVYNRIYIYIYIYKYVYVYVHVHVHVYVYVYAYVYVYVYLYIYIYVNK